MMQQAPMAPKAVQSPPPGAEKGGNDEYFKMVARIPDMTDEELNTYIGTGYGGLALAEVSRRNRSRMVEQAKEAGMVQGQGTIAEGQMAQLMQNRMREKLAADDRFGLNNIVTQAEQGGLEFGQPTTLAGGGMVAFQAGGLTQEERDRAAMADAMRKLAAAGMDIGTLPGRGLAGAAEFAITRPLRALGVPVPYLPESFYGGNRESLTPYFDKLRSQATEGPIVGRQTPKATQADVRKVDNAIDKKAAEAKPTKEEKKEAKDMVAGLKSLTAEDILKGEDALLASRGLGSFGAGVKGNIEKRAKRGEETYGRAMASEPFLAAAQAVGGGGAKPRRMGKLETLAAAVSAGATSAAGINRERAKYQDSLDDLRDKVALQQELYDRGRVSDAMKLERTIKQQQEALALEREKLASLTQYRQDMIRAQAGKGAGKIPQTILTELEKQDAEIRAALRNQQITPNQAAQELALLEQKRRGYLASGIFANATFGERDTAGED